LREYHQGVQTGGPPTNPYKIIHHQFKKKEKVQKSKSQRKSPKNPKAKEKVQKVQRKKKLREIRSSQMKTLLQISISKTVRLG